MRRASLAAAALATAVALSAGLIALTGSIDSGVVLDEQSRLVVDVYRYSFGEASGIRLGDSVIQFRRADEPGGWALKTAGTDGRLVGVQPAEAILRASSVAALLAGALAALAFASARSNAESSTEAAAASVALSAIPALLSYGLGFALFIPVVAAVAPWAWVIAWRRKGRSWAPAVAGLVAGLFVLVGLAWADPIVQLDAPRLIVGGWIAASTFAMLLAGLGMTGARLRDVVSSVALLDAVVITCAVAAAVAFTALGIHVLLAVTVVVLPLVVLARSRQRVGRLLDGLLLAEVREREGIRAMEAERARVAREIHDDPLQQIAGVIHALETDGNTEDARDSLRNVASHLRGVATELYPPVLDDLGLAPAIAAAARTMNDSRVVCTIDNLAGYQRAARPPEEVELAAYRITQEALANAVRHSQGSRIEVAGSVEARLVRLTVTDDGKGVEPAVLAEAMGDGHMGMVSMRRRAAAIGATLTLEPASTGGAAVTLEWRP